MKMQNNTFQHYTRILVVISGYNLLVNGKEKEVNDLNQALPIRLTKKHNEYSVFARDMFV